MHSLHDTFWNSQCRVSPFKPGFSAFPLEYAWLVAKNAADRSFAETPQFRYFTHAIMSLESDTGWRRRATWTDKAGLGGCLRFHYTPSSALCRTGL